MDCYLCGHEAQRINIPSNPLLHGIECPICGRYIITSHVLMVKLASVPEKKYLLSALTRQASDAGKPLTINTENFDSLIESISYPLSPLKKMNDALLFFMKKHNRADELIDPNLATDYPLVIAHDAYEFRYFLETLEKQGLLEAPENTGGIHFGRIRLTPKGWERALELQKSQIDSDQAFVAMSFSSEFNDAWQNGFKPALEAVGFHPYRVDQDEYNGRIDDKIITEIQHSGLLVADFSGHRQSVYFEAGFAKGLGIPVIWTCRESDIGEAHFDTRQYNHVLWNNPDEILLRLKLRVESLFPRRQVT
jgi:hypothetical protein